MKTFLLLSCFAMSSCSTLGVPVRLLDSTVKLETNTMYGSGCVISCVPDGDGYLVHILTVAHMDVPEAVRHPTQDLAIFTVRSSIPRRVLRMRSTAPTLGEQLYSAGSPHGIPTQVYRGYCGDGGWISMPAAPGSSGGPVVDRDCYLVGVVAGGMITENGIFEASFYIQRLDLPWILGVLRAGQTIS